MHDDGIISHFPRQDDYHHLKGRLQSLKHSTVLQQETTSWQFLQKMLTAVASSYWQLPAAEPLSNTTKNSTAPSLHGLQSVSTRTRNILAAN
jgi:hypothetical protein